MNTTDEEYHAIAVGDRVCRGYKAKGRFESAVVIGVIDDEKLGRVVVARRWLVHKRWHEPLVLVDIDFTDGVWRLWRDKDAAHRTAAPTSSSE